VAASPAQGINCPRRCTQVPWSYCYGLASRLVGTAGQPWEAGISIAQLAIVPRSSDPCGRGDKCSPWTQALKREVSTVLSRVPDLISSLDSCLVRRAVRGKLHRYSSAGQVAEKLRSRRVKSRGSPRSQALRRTQTHGCNGERAGSEEVPCRDHHGAGGEVRVHHGGPVSRAACRNSMPQLPSHAPSAQASPRD